MKRYEALRVSSIPYSNKFLVQGQRPDTLNWEPICRGLEWENEQLAENYIKGLAKKEGIKAFNKCGYEIQ